MNLVRVWECVGFNLHLWHGRMFGLPLYVYSRNEVFYSSDVSRRDFSLSFMDRIRPDKRFELRNSIRLQVFSYVFAEELLYVTMKKTGMPLQAIYDHHPQLTDKLANFDYADNIRMALVGDRAQEEEYQRRENRGCCGSRDEIIEISGKHYTFGFNYGH